MPASCSKSRDGKVTSGGAVRAFAMGRACSDTLFNVLSRAFGRPMKPEEKAAVTFAGGLMQHGYQCGMIWGAALAAGAEAHRRYVTTAGATARAEAMAIHAAQKVVTSFRDANEQRINCEEITHLNKQSTTWQLVKYFLLKGGTVGCFRMAGRYAPMAYQAVSDALANDQAVALPDTPSGDADALEGRCAPGSRTASRAGGPWAPVSCAAELARRLGEPDEHVVMAAGLAGGIGLSGGGCGALGAAIWLNAMRWAKQNRGKVDWKDPRALALVERFIKAADYELECEEIIGRTFDSVTDHAEHIRGGGCAELLEVLAGA